MARPASTIHAVFASLALTWAASARAWTEPHDVRIEVTNVRNEQGVVWCSLFTSPEGFPKKVSKAIARVSATGTGRLRVCLFPAVRAEGRFAVSVLHDEDADGELKTNVFGVPLEGWGVSNNAPPSAFAPPTFDAASCAVDGKPLQIWLHY